MADFEAVTLAELGAGDVTPGIEPNVAFETENNIVVQAHVTSGTEPGWHHHGDRHVCGYLLEGTAAFGFGLGGSELPELNAGDFFQLQPSTIHLDLHPSDEEQVFILNFVGSGPPVVNVCILDSE